MSSLVIGLSLLAWNFGLAGTVLSVECFKSGVILGLLRCCKKIMGLGWGVQQIWLYDCMIQVED